MACNNHMCLKNIGCIFLSGLYHIVQGYCAYRNLFMYIIVMVGLLGSTVCAIIHILLSHFAS